MKNMIAVLFLISYSAHASLDVTIDHNSGAMNFRGSTEVRRNEILKFTIINTKTDCFYFNQTVVAPGATGDLAEAGASDTVRFMIPHDGTTETYRITATLQPGKSEASCGLAARSWDISVTTSGWKLGFSGMFAFDDLTDPVYYLDPGTQDVGGVPQDGFTITQDRFARDDFTVGAAVTAHLFHSRKYKIFGSDVTWAPMSFGVGVAGSDQARYYLGTSLKFGDKWYVTLGGVFGKEARLPNGKQEGDFVTDSNAIATLDDRNSTAFFLGISVGIGDVDLSPLTSPFTKKEPQPDSQ